MADFSVIVDRQCSARSHVDLTVNVTTPRRTIQFPLRLDRSDWDADTREEIQDAVTCRIRSWFKETNPPPGQVKALLEAQVFKY